MSSEQSDTSPAPANDSGLPHWEMHLCFVCMLLPWLNPFAGGPSSWVQPWLFSAACCALSIMLLRPGFANPTVALGLATMAALALVRTGWTGEAVALVGACLLIYLWAGLAGMAGGRAALIDAVAMAWLVAAAASAAMGLIQYFGVAERFAPWVSLSSAGEAIGNLRQRNQFATLTVIGMAASLWLVPRRLSPRAALVLMAWLAIGNAATTSRTGLAEIILLALLAFVWPGARRQRALLWLGALCAYALAALALPMLLEAATGIDGNALWQRVAAADSCSSRRVLWTNVLHLIAQQPWLGWGWGELDYAHFITLYEGPRFCDILDNAHSLPLHLAVELGIPAALLACAALLWAVLCTRPWRECEPARQMAWAVLVVIGVHSLLEYPLWYGPFQMAAGLCLGILWPRRGAQTDGLLGRATAGALAVSLAAVCAYAAWDYHRVSQIYLPVESRAAAFQDDPLPMIRKSWLFRNQARFAELTITSVSRANAPWVHDTALALLHYSPEPRVIEKLIESETLLCLDQEATGHLQRLRAAFPEAYDAWSQAQRKPALAASQVD